MKELEICLRSRCQCLKVVSNQLNGAHLVIPPASSGEATLAVRAYYAKNLLPDISPTEILSDIILAPNDDLDGLLRFQQSFALTIVFFVLTPEEKDRHLDNMGSFVRRAMHRLTSSVFGNSSSSSSNTTRVLIVPSSEDAVQALVTFADALAPAKRRLKQSFYDQQRQAHFVAPFASEETAASFAIRALREWAFRHNVPEYEMDIVIKLLGSLEAVVEHSATGLSAVPISRRTKTLLHHFFHGDESTDWPSLAGNGEASNPVPSNMNASPFEIPTRNLSHQNQDSYQSQYNGTMNLPPVFQHRHHSQQVQQQQQQQQTHQPAQANHNWVSESHHATGHNETCGDLTYAVAKEQYNAEWSHPALSSHQQPSNVPGNFYQVQHQQNYSNYPVQGPPYYSTQTQSQQLPVQEPPHHFALNQNQQFF